MGEFFFVFCFIVREHADNGVQELGAVVFCKAKLEVALVLVIKESLREHAQFGDAVLVECVKRGGKPGDCVTVCRVHLEFEPPGDDWLKERVRVGCCGNECADQNGVKPGFSKAGAAACSFDCLADAVDFNCGNESKRDACAKDSSKEGNCLKSGNHSEHPFSIH